MSENLQKVFDNRKLENKFLEWKRKWQIAKFRHQTDDSKRRTAFSRWENLFDQIRISTDLRNHNLLKFSFQIWQAQRRKKILLKKIDDLSIKQNVRISRETIATWRRNIKLHGELEQEMVNCFRAKSEEMELAGVFFYWRKLTRMSCAAAEFLETSRMDLTYTLFLYWQSRTRCEYLRQEIRLELEMRTQRLVFLYWRVQLFKKESTNVVSYWCFLVGLEKVEKVYR
jgi:hypothetical protein